MARHQFITLIDALQWRVLHFAGGRFSALRVFSEQADDRDSLLRWWQCFPGARLHFVVNLAEEQYQVEALPSVRGAAGRQLLMRKLAAWPYSQGLHTAFKLDHVQRLRREDRYLFSAFFYPPLSEWLPQLQAHGLRITGIYTQTLCMPHWLPALCTAFSSYFCIDWQPAQVRVSFLRQHQVFFSQCIALTEAQSAQTEDPLQRIMYEIGQIRLTLISQHCLEEDEGLGLLWISQEKPDMSVLEQHLPFIARSQYCADDVFAKRQDARLLPHLLKGADGMAIQVVLANLPLPNFAPAAALLQDKVQRLKQHIHVAGVTFGVLMLAIIGMGEQAIQKMHFKSHQIEKQLSLWQSAKGPLAVHEESLPRLRALTEAVRGVETSSRLPGRVLSVFQRLLADPHGQRLKKLEWKYGPRSDDRAGDMVMSDWEEIVFVTVYREKVTTEKEWRQLIEKLRQAPEVARVDILALPAADKSGRHGDTRQAGTAHEQILKLHFWPNQIMASS